MELKIERYLVLGGSGFIGTYLVNFLKLKGFEVTNIDVKESLYMDLKQLQISELDRYDGCFFLAWDVGGAKYINDMDKWTNQFENNIAIINNVIPQLRQSKIPFLFVSSQLAGVDLSPYSLTKQLGEGYCLTIPNCTIARQWNVYGSIENYNTRSHIISDLIHQARETGKITLLTTGIELRRFVHLQDLCRAYLMLLQNNLGEIYDVRSGEYISILELAKLVGEILNVPVVPGSKLGINPIVRDIKTVPNWEPAISLQQGLVNLING